MIRDPKRKDQVIMYGNFDKDYDIQKAKKSSHTCIISKLSF